MKRIKFSHNYFKLHGQTEATLVAVLSLTIDRFTPRELLEYDTKYDGGYFPLRSGNYLQLIFVGNLQIPFCTIRRAFPKQKVDYYKSSVGERFEVCVMEGE